MQGDGERAQLPPSVFVVVVADEHFSCEYSLQ